MIELHVLTTEDPADAVPIPAVIPCTGEMTCTCAPCQTERAQRMRQPRRPTRQPWEDAA